MIFKTDWTTYLHGVRKDEVDKVFTYFGEIHFQKGLEVGCGDGYQTTLLYKKCREFISGDLNFKRIKDDLKVSQVEYKQCDADNIEGVFSPEEFDFIFSSNILEHVASPQNFLINSRVFLKEDGYAVHIIPSRFVKVTYIALHYVNLFVLVLDRLVGLFRGKKVFRGEGVDLENNINKVEEKNQSKFSRIFFPQIHGNFGSHREEFEKFGRKSWQNIFEKTGYEVVKYIKGPAFSGYGFGLNRLRLFLENIGWSSEHIFVLKKKL